MLDWYLPPLDYTTRSALTTYFAISLFMALGCWLAYKTRSLRASALASLMTGALAAAMKVAGIALVIMIWQNVDTQRSGGLEEALELPWLIILPGVIVSMIGGLAGKALARFSRATPAR
jgi:cytochrome bd-type quinol oxidase subunit 2